MKRSGFPLLLICFLFAPAVASTAGAETVQDLYRVDTYAADGEAQLTVATPSGNIEVISDPSSDSIRVELWVERALSIWGGSRSLSSYRIVNFKRGEEIVAAVEPKERISGHRISFSYRIRVPEGIEMDLRSSAGNITANDIHGIQRLYTNAGDITVKGGSGEILAKSNAGDITVINSQGEIRLSVVGGNIRADAISGAMVARVIRGDIVAGFDDVSEGINLESTLGDISVRLPSRSYRFHAEGTRVDFSVTDQFRGISRSNRVSGDFMGGDGPMITLTTVKGIISIRTQ